MNPSNLPQSGDPSNRRCAAHTTAGAPCRRWAIKGGAICPVHGGSAPAVRAAAERRSAEAEIQRAAARTGIRSAGPIVDVLHELQRLAGEARAWKDHLAGIVDNLAESQLRTTDDHGREQIRAEIVLYERAVDRLGTLLATIARLNIDERLARIDEATALMVLRAIDAGLSAVGVTGPAAQIARQAAGRHLRLVTAGEG